LIEIFPASSHRRTGLATIALYLGRESWEALMEKLIVLCVLMGVIGLLAELAPAPQRSRARE
jgi:hypothetical protein